MGSRGGWAQQGKKRDEKRRCDGPVKAERGKKEGCREGRGEGGESEGAGGGKTLVVGGGTGTVQRGGEGGGVDALKAVVHGNVLW